MPEIHSYRLNLHHHSYQEQFCFPKKSTWCKQDVGREWNWEKESHWTVLASQQQAWKTFLWNILWVWEFPGERCFHIWKGLRVVRHLKGKVEVAGNHWNYPKASKNRLVKQASNRVGSSRRSLARKFNISQSFVHHVLKKAGVKHYKCQNFEGPGTTPAQEQRQSEPGWGKWAWDPVRAEPESNPRNVPQALPMEQFCALL